MKGFPTDFTDSTDLTIRDEETYAIIGAAMEVHRKLGCGFLEPVYQEAFSIELCDRGIPFQREVALEIQYKGRILACSYRADLICFEDILVELKALRRISSVERSQAINYLNATGFCRALILNFGASSLQFERIVN